MTWILLAIVLGFAFRARLDRTAFEHELRVLEAKLK
jgi:hypothetical protein